jgi:hypothetical protein
MTVLNWELHFSALSGQLESFGDSLMMMAAGILASEPFVHETV